MKMEKRVAEKYKNLSKACSQYPEIVLVGVEERGGYLKHNQNARVYVQPKKRAKDGFIEKFCL